MIVKAKGNSFCRDGVVSSITCIDIVQCDRKRRKVIYFWFVMGSYFPWMNAISESGRMLQGCRLSLSFCD
jgi:hypothetical protein